MHKILIVEDDQFISKMYAKKFQVAGYDVQLAYDGEEGLVKMRSFQPHLVLMDIMMPKLNGIDATEKAKADPTIKHIPILILTNLSTNDDTQTAVKKGAIDYMVKSDYTPAQIVEKAQQILSSLSVNRTNVPSPLPAEQKAA